ncbi:hypothetical protein FQZ97_708540 [compost metagenome]
MRSLGWRAGSRPKRAVQSRATWVPVCCSTRTLAMLLDLASASRSVIGPAYCPLLLVGLQPLAAVKGRSSTSVPGITRASSAAEYSSGLSAEPGWRQPWVTWLNG